MKKQIIKLVGAISFTAICFALNPAVGLAEMGHEPSPEQKAEHKAEHMCDQEHKYTCSMCPGEESDKPGDCPTCGMALVKTECEHGSAEYTCPMHPEVKSDKPGDCQKCGMKLIKSEKTDNQEHQAMMYACPMHPEEKSDKADADCPKCGMKLVPVK